MIKIIGIIFLSSLLTACGFRLQGTQALPPQLQQVYVNTTQVPHSAIAPDLTVALQNNDVKCTTNADTADYTINIIEDSQTNQQIGTGASQETRKYELIYTVTFSLVNQAGIPIYGPTTVTSTTIHYVYSGQVLGNNQEEATLYQPLRRNVIQKILFKLGSNDVKTALLTSAMQTTQTPQQKIKTHETIA